MSCLGQKLFILFLLNALQAVAIVNVPDLPKEGLLDPPNNAFIDPKIDYEVFSGRVSDKDKSSRYLKIHVENNNSKFFRAGDEVLFTVANSFKRSSCHAYVKSIEDFYFVIYVKSYGPCWDEEKYLKRGSILKFKSAILGQRVFEASKYREMLILRKEGFLKQMNGINHFLWGFDQQRVKKVAEYDERINHLKKQKQFAIDNMLKKKQESLILQNELAKKLDHLDESLKYYRIERQEYMVDRWNMDHHISLPYGQRPEKIKKP